MKNLLFITLTLLISTATYSQTSTWGIVDLNGVTNQHLNAIEFADNNNGWAVGDNGTIIYTNDGGQSWEEQVSGTNTDLLGISFVSNSTGWVYGANGTLLRTTDSGNSWTILNGPSVQILSITSLEFVDSLHGWIGGQNIGLYFTGDGGNTWDLQFFISGSIPSTPYSIYFANTDTGWCYYYYHPFGATVPAIQILKTEDQGNTWIEKEWIEGSISGETVADIKSIDNSVWVIQGNRLIVSTDNGDTWSITSFYQDYPPNGPGFKEIDFASNQVGWIVGEMGIIQTSDSGNSWQQETIGTSEFINSISVISENNVWAVGENATLLHYSNVLNANVPDLVEHQLLIYPNPFTDQTVISSSIPLNDATVRLYNVNGRQTKVIERINEREFIFDRGNLSNGVYFIQLFDKNRQIGKTMQLIISD